MKNKKQITSIIASIFSLITIIIFTLILNLSNSEIKDIPNTNASSSEETQGYFVTEVVDGDTFKIQLDESEATVRMIGIDTPETVHPNKPVECFGLEASNRLKELIEKKYVILEPDSTQNDTDQYGRLLRYVISQKGVNINYQMIEKGYAYEYTYKVPYIYQSEFKSAQEYAKNSAAGLWGQECTT
jgi:micrococcal nuclease